MRHLQEKDRETKIFQSVPGLFLTDSGLISKNSICVLGEYDLLQIIVDNLNLEIENFVDTTIDEVINNT